MNLSQRTIAILKNFATISPNIYIHQGNQLRTRDEATTILAAADIEETFPVDVPVADLNRFLNILDLVKDANIEFGEKSCEISNSQTRVEYHYGASRLVTNKLEKTPGIDNFSYVFPMLASHFDDFRRASSVMDYDMLQLSNSEGKIIGRLLNMEDAGADTYEVELIDFEDRIAANFSTLFNIEKFKFLKSNYQVAVCEAKIARFKGDTATYWLAPDRRSTYEE